MTDREKLRKCILNLCNENDLSMDEIGTLLKLGKSTVTDIANGRLNRIKESRARHYIRRYQDLVELGYVGKNSKVISLYGEPK